MASTSRRDARALAQPLALERVRASSQATVNFEQRDEIYFRGQIIISLPDQLRHCLLWGDDRVIWL